MATSDGQQNGGLPTLAVSRAMLATARGRQKIDVIMDSADPRKFVRQLPAEDLYFAIREVGLEDAGELVRLASPGQFRAFVDLDVWDEGLPDPQRILQWLELAAFGGTENLRAKRAGLDPELILITLKTFTTVHSLEEEEDPVLTSNNFLRTAEGKYIVEINAEGEVGSTVRQVLEDFIDEAPFIATRLFESLRWESTAELEETALRWRTGRVRDMGFPELEEALRIWTPLPAGWKPEPGSVEPGPIAGVPALLLVSSRAALFLDRVVERLPDENRPAFNEGLIYLLNCAIVADGIDPKALDFARESLAGARDMLSLGLELSSKGDEEVALAILATTSPVELFRVAVTQLVAMGRNAAQAVKPLSFGSAGATALDAPDSEILSGLRRKRPRLYDPPAPGGAPKPGGDWRPYRTRADLAVAEGAIVRAQAAGAALVALGFDIATVNRLADASGRATTAVSVSQLLMTAALTDPEPVRPLRPQEIGNLCRLFSDGRLTPQSRESLKAWFDRLTARLPSERAAPFSEIAARCLQQFEEEVGPPCAAGALEAPFVETVLVEGAVPPPPEVVADTSAPE